MNINKLELLAHLTENSKHDYFAGGKVQVFCSLQILGSRTGIPKGLKQKWTIPEGRGLAILEFGGLGGMSILEFLRARGG